MRLQSSPLSQYGTPVTSTDRMKNVFGTTTTQPVGTLTPEITEVNNDVENPSMDEKPQQDAQGGIQKVEAVTLLWTKKQLLFAYFL